MVLQAIRGCCFRSSLDEESSSTDTCDFRFKRGRESERQRNVKLSAVRALRPRCRSYEARFGKRQRPRFCFSSPIEACSPRTLLHFVADIEGVYSSLVYPPPDCASTTDSVLKTRRPITVPLEHDRAASCTRSPSSLLASSSLVTSPRAGILSPDCMSWRYSLGITGSGYGYTRKSMHQRALANVMP